MSRTVLILAYHYSPSGAIGARRVTALAHHLAAGGTRVIIVSAFGGAAITAHSELFPGIIAVPVPMSKRRLLDFLVWLKRRVRRGRRSVAPRQTDDSAPAGQRTSGSRALSWYRLFFETVYFPDEFKSWTLRAALAAWRAGKHYGADVLLCSGPPRTTLLGGAFAAQRLRIPYIADFRDPWSEPVGDAPSSAARLRRWLIVALERWVVHSAAAITCTTSGLVEHLGQRFPAIAARLAVVRNGFDGSIASLPAAPLGRLNLLYAGEIYANRDPFPLLEALEELLSLGNCQLELISLTFVGHCEAYRGRLIADWLRDKRCASVVRLLPPVRPEAISEFVREATVLVNFAQNWPLQVPAKTYEQLASGRELLVLCERDCETARIVESVAGVSRVDPAEPGAILAALKDLYQRHVVQGIVRIPDARQVIQYSRQAMNTQMAQIIDATQRTKLT